jgi:hypothetical protein
MRALSQSQSLRCWAVSSNSEDVSDAIALVGLPASEGLGQVSEVFEFVRSKVPLYPAQFANSLWDWYNYDVLYGDLTVKEILENSGLNEDQIQSLLPRAIESVRGLVSEFQKSATSEKNNEAVAPLALPETAPEKYQGNRGGSKGGENIVEFLRRVWMPWIEAGVLTRSALRRLDKAADRGVDNWLQDHPLPADINLPTKTDVLNKQYGLNELSADELREKMREYARVSGVMRQRINALEAS